MTVYNTASGRSGIVTEADGSEDVMVQWDGNDEPSYTLTDVLNTTSPLERKQAPEPVNVPDPAPKSKHALDVGMTVYLRSGKPGQRGVITEMGHGGAWVRWDGDDEPSYCGILEVLTTTPPRTAPPTPPKPEPEPEPPVPVDLAAALDAVLWIAEASDNCMMPAVAGG